MASRFHAPTAVDEALSVLARDEELVPVAGGTDLVVGARQGRYELPSTLLGLQALHALRSTEVDGSGALVLGALVTHADVLSSELVHRSWTALADASSLVGSPATRNVGTVAGNLANASPAMELGSPLLVYDATVVLESVATGRREVTLADFVAGPRRTVRRRDELVTKVRVPVRSGRCGSAYLRLEYRRAMEIAVVGAAAAVTLADDDAVVNARVALTAVAPVCFRTGVAEESLRGRKPEGATLAEAASLAAEGARPIGDVRATAEYRRTQITVVVRRALETAVARARGERIGVPANRHVGPLAGS